LLGHIKSRTFNRYNEGFFSVYVVLVEGESDKEYILKSMLLNGFDADENNIAVIYCDGKTNIKRIYTIFELFGIPLYVIFDGDVHNISKTRKKNDSIKVNRELMNLIQQDEKIKSGFPDTGVYNQGAVFKDTIEEETKIYFEGQKEGIYQSIWESVRLIAGPIKNKKKNAYFVHLFLEKAFETHPKGIPILNEIIQEIRGQYNKIYN
ncbi:MAG: TOPRIM nucleotidyl transferase/hydrolase domain-containing protein, partial [Promethearchaeota archaeon]